LYPRARPGGGLQTPDATIQRTSGEKKWIQKIRSSRSQMYTSHREEGVGGKIDTGTCKTRKNDSAEQVIAKRRE